MNMNPFKKLWFWLLILSVIGFITSFVMFERYGQTNNPSDSTPVWVWILFIVSAIIWFVALGLYIADYANYVKEQKIAEACGLVKPKPQPKIECPKKECYEKKVVECVKKSPCASPSVTDVVVTEETTTVSTIIENTSLPKISPMPTTFTSENISSTASLKPMASFSPPVNV